MQNPHELKAIDWRIAALAVAAGVVSAINFRHFQF